MTAANAQPPAAPRAVRPWRPQSQGYVLLLGGFIAVTVIALVNASRLGVPRRGRLLIAAAGVLGLFLDAVMFLGLKDYPVLPLLSLDADLSPSPRVTLTGSLVSMLLCLTVHIVQLGAQRPYDHKGLLLSRGADHAPMWLAGAVAVVIGAPAEYLTLAVLEG
ncbi:hypothetical protein ACFFMN_15680 [Planobispora siamensis]|uniref:Uncharacterized protein n=1 Tax=Planobispora siamensis TaxID=936338 RepID=A0A8J3SQP7_9ACTN|nr:hypothetical protein [Planobispora siamensis]GIH93943.1 hypothetical protein Psi01_45730 [Planobispora siamensis]